VAVVASEVDRGGEKATRGLIDVQTPSAEPFRMLRLAVDLRPRTDVHRPVMFTSADPAEGKSLVAANYALVAAQTERKVLLVDGDMRKPTQHRLFGVRNVPGLTEVIAAGADYTTVVVPVQEQPGVLHLLTAGTALPNVGDVISSGPMKELFDSVGAKYDLVVIDSPPLLAASDAATLASNVCADVVFVVAQGTKKRHVTRAISKLDLVGVEVLGFVANREGHLAEYEY
jgi:capsular exopolysaccharide synthesis family protein